MSDNSLSFLTVIYLSVILLFAGICERAVNHQTIYYSSVKETFKHITEVFN